MGETPAQQLPEPADAYSPCIGEIEELGERK
jgi:hypothetical protein